MAHTAYLPIIADRYGAVVRHIYVVGLDLAGIDMRAQVRLHGDVPGAPLLDLRTVTNGNAEGLRLVEVASDGAGLPTSHVELVINESTMESLPFAGEIGAATQLAWDWQVVILGRKRRLAKGEFEITGDGVTGAEAAPANRVAPYGYPRQPVRDVWSSARLTFGEEQVTVQIDGADLVAPLAKKATDAAVRAEGSRDAAQLASATALAASRYYPTKAAGEAASTVNQLFSTDDGAGNLIYYRRTAGGSVEIGRALTPSILASGGGAKRVGFLGDGTGETLVDASTLLQTAVDVRRFGAKCDGVTDDTAAVQKALDFCTIGTQLSGSYDPEAIGNLAYPKALLVTGMCLISSPLIIKNRRVDRTLGRLSIVGLGQGGFVIGGNFELFTSSEAPDPLYPNAEMLVFQNLRFLSHDPVNSAYTHSGQFLRVWFEQCEWWRVACVNTTRYTQEWYFLHCMVRALSAGRAFFTSAGGYVIRSNRCKFQNFASGALGVFQLHDPNGNNGAVGCSFESDTYESSFGPYIRASICQGLTVSGLYTENNDGPLIDLRCRPVPGSRNSGVDISGNELHANTANQSNPNFYNVIWGPGGGNARGNTSKGNLHDNLKRTSGGLYVGCDVNELQADDRIVGPGRMYSLELDALDNLVPDPSARYGTFASAEMNVVTPVNGVVAHTVCLPPPVLGIRERIVVNPLNAQFTLLPSNLDDGAKFRGGAPNGGVEFPPNTARRFRVATNGVWIMV